MRQLDASPPSVCDRVQPKVGTTYSTSGAGGGAELGIHATVRGPTTLTCSSVGVGSATGSSTSSSKGRYSRKRLVPSSQYSMRR